MAAAVDLRALAAARTKVAKGLAGVDGMEYLEKEYLKITRQSPVSDCAGAEPLLTRGRLT